MGCRTPSKGVAIFEEDDHITKAQATPLPLLQNRIRAWCRKDLQQVANCERKKFVLGGTSVAKPKFPVRRV